jgi:prephenate dehydratase
MRTLTLGPAGTYSHRAARAVADGEDDVAFRESVTAVVAAVAGGEADRGVVPVENSIEGSVTESLDALAEYEVSVLREVVTPIRHALIAQEERFETVTSHSQALAQCRAYLDREYPDVEREPAASTASGVERAREDAAVAAIAHPDTAAELDGGLRVLAEDIQERSSNATRFFLLGPVAERTTAGGKTSVVVYPNDNYPGLLLELLEPFADRDINLTRVESRPSGERLGDYVFHVDFAAGAYEERVQDALAAVDELAADGWVRRLGSYDVEHVV